MFKHFWGSHEQQAQPRPTNSWYPPPVSSPSSSSHPATPSVSASGSFSMPSLTDKPSSLSNVSPAEAAGIIAVLKNKSVEELKKLLSDKDAYNSFLHSLEPVKTQNRVGDELRNETLQLARQNMEKEPCIVELRNQCKIIRTSELATALEKLHELERKKEETQKYYSPSTLLLRLQEEMSKTEEESEALHKKLLDSEVDLTSFVQKYKKMRHTYHRRALTYLAATTSVSS